MKKINIIDYVIILVAIVTVFLLSKTLLMKTNDVWVEVVDGKNQITGSIEPMLPWEAKRLEVGSTIFNDVGEGLGEIVDIKKTPWENGDRMAVTMVIKMHLIYDKRQRLFLFNGNPLREGNKIYLNFEKVNFNGSVRGIYTSELAMKESRKPTKTSVTIKVKLTDYELAVLQAIETMPGVKKIETWPKSGSTKQDAVLMIRLSDVICNENICYDQNYQPLVIGNSYWMNNGTVGFKSGTTIIDRKIENDN